MRYSADKLAGIDLGRQGENLARTVEIDVSALLSRWPEAVISLLVKRKQDAEPYVANAHVVDGVLYWPITAADTASAGDGKVELRAVCGEVLAKSATGSTRVTASLTGNEAEPPEAAQGWVDQVIAAGGGAQASAEAAREAATEATASAESAEAAAEKALTARDEVEELASGARASAEAAQDSANAAGSSASAAKESDVNSKASEEAAATSAREAKASEEQAKASETAAREYAERADSARQSAKAAATDAHTDSESAKASEAVALNARSEAEEFSSGAHASAEAAKNSEEQAAASAAAVQEAESNVKVSETSATTSAREAGASAEQAKASETAAQESAERAETACQSAEAAATAAHTDRENTKASESAALNAQNEAETFATNSRTSAEAAKNSEERSSVAASAAQASETNAKASENAAAASEKNALTAEANAKASADAALASQEKAGASEIAASEAAECAETAAQKAETTAETAADEVRAGLLNDAQITFTSAWSSRQTVEQLCPEVEASGNPVQLPDLLGGHTLSVKHSFTPIQHFDWMKKNAATTQRTTTGAQLLDVSKARANGPHYGLNIRIEGEWVKIDGTANVKATGRYSFAILNVGQPELQGKGYAVACFGDGRIEGSYGLRNESESAVAVYATLSPDTAFSAAFQVMISAEAAGAWEPYTGGQAAPAPGYPQRLEDSLPEGEYCTPCTAPEGGYWRLSLDVPLGGVEGCADALEIDAYTGRYRVVRRTGVIVLDGSEGWSIGGKLREDGSDWYYQSNAKIADAPDASATPLLCDHYPANNISNSTANTGVAIIWQRVRVRWGAEGTTGDWRAQLAASPMTIRYALAQATITAEQAVRSNAAAGTALKPETMELTVPDPEHLCAVTGYDALKLMRCGKNLISQEHAMRGVYGYVLGADDLKKEPVFLVSGCTYTFSFDKAFLNRTHLYADKTSPEYDPKLMGYYAPGEKAKTFTFDRPTGWYQFHLYNTPTWTEQPFTRWQLEVGAAATEYEPYREEAVYSLAFPQTVYGGTADAETGETSASWRRFALDGTESWTAGTAGERTYFNCRLQADENLRPVSGGSINAAKGRQKCSHFALGNPYTEDADDCFWCYSVVSSPYPYLRLRSTAHFQDAAALKSYLAARFAEGNPVTVVYETAVPEQVQATGGQPIPALSGVNTLTTSADSLTVRGREDLRRTVASLRRRIAALESAAVNE